MDECRYLGDFITLTAAPSCFAGGYPWEDEAACSEKMDRSVELGKFGVCLE